MASRFGFQRGVVMQRLDIEASGSNRGWENGTQKENEE
jgi:hypothetical protein